MDRSPPPAPVTADDEQAHVRSEPRDSMFVLATIRREHGADVPVKVRNLSSGGLMAECPSGFVRGETVHIDLRGIGTVHGRIAWTASGRIGMQFDEPIDHRRARMPVGLGPKPLVSNLQSTTWRPAVR